MSIARPVLGIAAVVGGLTSLGSWLILQLGGVLPTQVFSTAVAIFGGAATFLLCVGGIAYLTGRQNGTRSLLRRFLFLVGAFGIPIPLFYIVVSRGAILEFPEIDMLLLAFLVFLGVYFLGNKNAT